LRERSSALSAYPELVKQTVALKDTNKHRTQINGKFNDVSSADENK
jgi:hypothetical protein